jgi:hypothetical protein
MKNFFWLVLFTNVFYGQGCSDAGFCTLENFQGTNVDTIAFKNSLKFGANIGSADNDVSVFGSYVEYSRKLNLKWELLGKITFLSQSIDGFSSSSLADAYLTSSFSASPSVKIIGGFKIPFTDGNLKDNGVALPMDFQPSLGTFDLILGTSKSYKNWTIVFAYQQPLVQNSNEFLAPANSNFLSTNEFKRAGDILLRTSYRLAIRDKIIISPSFLPIYHISNDKFTDADNVEKEISGSRGLTLNANLYINFMFNKKNSLELSLGSPLVVRETRPDGLTRSFVANLEYKISF